LVKPSPTTTSHISSVLATDSAHITPVKVLYNMALLLWQVTEYNVTLQLGFLIRVYV